MYLMFQTSYRRNSNSYPYIFKVAELNGRNTLAANAVGINRSIKSKMAATQPEVHRI